MEWNYMDMILRDSKETDIEDEIRWNTVETEWALWDAPWETEEELRNFNPDEYRKKELELQKKPKEGFRWRLEVDTVEGNHIGSVNTYLIDENYEWVRKTDVREGQKVFYAVGIEINESAYWNRGFGTKALAGYIWYHLDSGHKEICVQTWSGNLRMIQCAQKLGFYECMRRAGIRKVRGGVYDGLTFCLDEEKFRRDQAK